ncbi:hypothetical protein KGF54_003221 [Candida jiufengensis]|uniref:uncharacterized protein n=1 Tax=Candida jiufengensis TaxID=497108 RepID=UPI0022244F62|nr:uncharacterized protein KGF54_003221 [Candida jiufengensis]KAI5952355.1 hypothetical protein KGF54_003221 [Candida jiufengensis]
MSTQSETVFVTGATGFIAQHIVKQLIEKGYKVIGSVRSKDKGENLKSLITEAGLDSNFFDYVIITNLIDKQPFDEVFSKHPEISIVLHTASPVDFNAKDAIKEIIEPAVLGTKHILQSAKQHPNIKKFVITSSIVATIDVSEDGKPKGTITEESWSGLETKHLSGPEDTFVGYGISKTHAGQEVVRFQNEEHPNFTIVSILPSYVFGPQAFEVKDKSQLNFSAELVNKVLKLKPNEEIPPLTGIFIDVRDVAHAHIKAFQESQKTNGKRLGLDAGEVTNELIASIINKNFPKVDIPKGSIEKSNNQLQSRGIGFDFSESKKILGFDYIPLEKSIVDSVQQILNAK